MSILETERLLFREHIAADLEFYCEMESDAVYRSPQKVHPREELERSFWNGVLPPKQLGLRATVFKPEGRYIGRCGLYPHRGNNGEIIPDEAVLAFYLARPHWGRGLATEAARAFVKYGFETLGLSRIVAGANVKNIASNRVIEKSGLLYSCSGGGENGGEQWHDYALRKEDYNDA